MGWWKGGFNGWNGGREVTINGRRGVTMDGWNNGREVTTNGMVGGMLQRIKWLKGGYNGWNDKRGVTTGGMC